MTTLTPDHTLAEIVTTRPGSARILESFDLDYCCGGRRTLAEACADAATDPAAVMEQLEQGEPGPAPDWSTMGPAELVDHLEATHHVHLHEELPRLTALADKVTGVHGGRHPELGNVRAVVHALRADLEPHLMKEERVLFPMIREFDAAETAPQFHCGTLRNPISVMMGEHDRAGELLAELRRLTGGYRTPEDGCASYQALYDGLAQLEADTHLHVHKENNLLFPAVQQMEADRSPVG